MKSFLLVTLLLAISATAHAALSGGIGDLLVTPTRIVLDRRTRTAEIALINTGNSPATYRIETQHMRMKENGDLVPVLVPADEPADAFAASCSSRTSRRPFASAFARPPVPPPASCMCICSFTANLLKTHPKTSSIRNR
jgi:hypothetical protein